MAVLQAVGLVDLDSCPEGCFDRRDDRTPESQPSHTSIFQASASITLVNAPLAQRVTQIISKSSWGDICSMQKEVKHVVTWTNLTSRGRKKTLLMRKAGERKAL